IAALRPPPTGQRNVFDAKLPGFGIRRDRAGPDPRLSTLWAGDRWRRATRRRRGVLRSELPGRPAVRHDGSAEDRAVGGGANREVEADTALHRLVQRVGNRLGARPAAGPQKPPALDSDLLARAVGVCGVAVSVGFLRVEPDPPRRGQGEAGRI